MRVRPERGADARAVRDVVTAAFGRVDEADLVDAIRASDGYVADLALVAEDDGAVVGYVMFSHVGLDGSPRGRLLSLAPVAVAPGLQRQGVGSALVRDGMRRADEMGEPAVCVLGHPSYYPRFGFEPARPLGIEPPDAGLPDDVWMVARLSAYDGSVQGRVAYPPAFGT